jgi:type IV secretory pathway VirB10-like protein
MKKTSLLSIATIIALVFFSSACRNNETPANKTAQPSPVASVTQNSNQPSRPIDQSNSNAAKPAITPPKPSDSPAQLIGEYEVREIQDKGVVTLVSSIQTKIVFLADGSYSRVSKKDGRVYHSDSGQFRLEPPDRLVLSIQLSGQKTGQTIQNPPIEKAHRFKLSPDGDELRLTNDKGSVAVYSRVSKPKAP